MIGLKKWLKKKHKSQREDSQVVYVVAPPIQGGVR